MKRPFSEITRLIAITCAGLLLVGCTAKHLAYRADSDLSPKLRAQSVPVWLPRTVLEFRCLGTVTTVQPSVLYLRAIKDRTNAVNELKELITVAEELGLELNDSEKPETKYSLKEPTLSARGERDPEALFYVKLDAGMFTKVEFTGQFAPDGIPGTMSSSAENKGFEFAMKSIEVAAGIAGKAMGVGLLKVDDLGDPKKADGTLLNRVKGQLQELRRARQALITGSTLPAPIDEKTLTKMLDEITKSEESLTAFFTGASTTKSFPLVVTIRPQNSHSKSYPLLRFEKAAGFGAATNHAVVRLGPIPPELAAKTQSAQQLVLKLSDQDLAERQMWSSLKDVSGSKRGLPFRVPARTHARVTLDEGDNREVRVLVTTDVLIAQWGEFAYLPPSMGSPGSTFKPAYYTDTGGLKELTVTATALSPDSLSALDKATGSIADALKSKADREAAAAKNNAANADELNQLKREADMLELQLKIQELRQKLLSPDDEAP